MTEDKSFAKNDQCLRLFSSRRQSPLLVHLMPRIRYCCAGWTLYITHITPIWDLPFTSLFCSDGTKTEIAVVGDVPSKTEEDSDNSKQLITETPTPAVNGELKRQCISDKKHQMQSLSQLKNAKEVNWGRVICGEVISLKCDNLRWALVSLLSALSSFFVQ